MSNTESLFREYERQIDDFHKSLTLWKVPRPQAIYAVLVAYELLSIKEQFERSASQCGSTSAARAQWINDGLMWSLRWLIEPDQKLCIRNTTDEQILTVAVDFMIHALNYGIIADFHVMHCRGWADYELMPQEQTVRFETRLYGGAPDESAWENHIYNCEQNVNPDEILRAGSGDIATVLRQHVVAKGGRLHVTGLPRDTNSIFNTEAWRRIEPLALPDDTEMLGFTMGEFRLFHISLFLWSRILQLAWLDGGDISLHMVQTESLDGFTSKIVTHSGLSAETVTAIIERLSYRPSKKSDISLTPLLVSDDEIAWSPNRVIGLRTERDLLKCMARGPKKMQEHAATVSGSLCHPLGRIIGKHFSDRGYQYQLDTLISSESDKTDIDVLLYNKKTPTEILLIEAKALVAPDEINETHTATGNLKYAQEQLRRAVTIIKGKTEAERKSIWDIDWKSIKQIYSVVVTSGAEPHSSLDISEIPIISNGTLRNRLGRPDFQSPKRFWEGCRDRVWQRPCDQARIAYLDIQIGPITYQLPCLG